MAESQQLFTVTVLTSEQALDQLVLELENNAARPVPLVAGIQAALASIGRQNLIAAINQLEAFKNKVQAQVAPLDPTLAAQLIAEAQAIIDAVNSGADPGASKIAISISKGKNGKPHLRVSGLPGRTPIVETSTNGADWVKIGVANRGGDGTYEFDDAQASDEGIRFYRAVSLK